MMKEDPVFTFYYHKSGAYIFVETIYSIWLNMILVYAVEHSLLQSFIFHLPQS